MSDQADRLVELALRRYELGRSDDGLPFLVETTLSPTGVAFTPRDHSRYVRFVVEEVL